MEHGQRAVRFVDRRQPDAHGTGMPVRHHRSGHGLHAVRRRRLFLPPVVPHLQGFRPVVGQGGIRRRPRSADAEAAGAQG